MSQLTREELARYAPGGATAVTIGNFDGVHLGHQHLVAYLIERARRLSLAPAAITLYPAPVKVLRPQEPMQYLTSLEERLELLHGFGLKVVVPLSFTSELAEIAPADFAGMLKQEFAMSLLVMGPDNAFGRSREGTPASMARIGARLGFTVDVLPDAVREADSKISATAIRAALAAGEIEEVSRQLGRNYSLRGPVVRGDQRGRQLGFPTANIAITPDRALPALGVYATWAFLGETRMASVTNIGRRPTFNGQTVSIETHIFAYEGDLYDRQLRIELVKRLRPEQSFVGVEQLRQQIAQDAIVAQQVLSESITVSER